MQEVWKILKIFLPKGWALTSQVGVEFTKMRVYYA
jgi:hypothetical protein